MILQSSQGSLNVASGQSQSYRVPFCLNKEWSDGQYLFNSSPLGWAILSQITCLFSLFLTYFWLLPLLCAGVNPQYHAANLSQHLLLWNPGTTIYLRWDFGAGFFIVWIPMRTISMMTGEGQSDPNARWHFIVKIFASITIDYYKFNQ